MKYLFILLFLFNAIFPISENGAINTTEIEEKINYCYDIPCDIPEESNTKFYIICAVAYFSSTVLNMKFVNWIMKMRKEKVEGEFIFIRTSDVEYNDIENLKHVFGDAVHVAKCSIRKKKDDSLMKKFRNSW